MSVSRWIPISSTFASLLFLLPLVAPSQAQTCTANGSDLNCSNTGNIPGAYNAVNSNSPGTTTATNSGSVGLGMSVFTNGNGTTTTTNSGSVGQGISNFTNGNGTTTTTNSGSVGQGISNFTNGNGTTTTTNSGSVGKGISNFTNGNGTATVINSGSVGQGISNFTNGNGTTTVINSGTVGQNINAFTNGNGTTTLINSGAIFQGVTLSVNGVGGSNLTLLPGSFIVGNITLQGTNNSVVMNAGNQNLTVNSIGSGLSVTGNVPFVFVGNRIVSLDPTSFAMQGSTLNDFARGVSSSIPHLQRGIPSDGGPLAFAAPDASARIEDVFATIPGLSAYSGEAMAFKNPTMVYSDGSAVWARGFGGSRVQDGDGTVLPGKSQFYGGMIGGDMRVRPDLRIGAFFGLGNSRFWVDQPFVGAGANLGNGNSDIAFGGAYAQYDTGATFLRAAVQVGGSRNSSTRNINNNLIAGGLETANASYNGWYVSPEATIGHRFALGQLEGAAYTLTPSLRLRYLHGSFDGYTETGTTNAPLTMGSRTVGTMEERGELKLTRTVAFAAQSQLSISGYGGVQGTQRAGDSTLNAAFLGQAIPFASPGQANVWGGFGGSGLEWRTRNVTLFSAAEYLWLSDNSTIVSGRGGFRVSF